MTFENTDQTVQVKELLAALKVLLEGAGEEAGVADMLGLWPDEYQASVTAGEPATTLPVLGHLPGLPLP